MNRQKLLGLLVASVIALTGCSQTAYNEEEEQEAGYEEGYYEEDGDFVHVKLKSGGKSKLASTSKGLGSSAKGSVSS